MHYIGMLAFHLPIPVLYDWPTALLSLRAAVIASAIALFVVSRKKMETVVRHEFDHAYGMEAAPDGYVSADTNKDSFFLDEDEDTAIEYQFSGKNEADTMGQEAAEEAVRQGLGIDQAGNPLPAKVDQPLNNESEDDICD